MKIITVVGARPQLVKAAIVSEKLQNEPSVKEVLVHTGQHYDHSLSGIFFDDLNMAEPKYNLNVGSHSHAIQTAKIMEKLEPILLTERPDKVLVYGDTNSSLAAALVAIKQKIHVIHVEAGLRSFNKKMPEEINRVLIDHVSSTLFTVDAISSSNLVAEGLSPRNIALVGDVMFDAFLRFGNRLNDNSLFLKKIGVRSRYALVTLHRAENVGNANRLAEIIKSLQRVSRDIKLVFPIHPGTEKAIRHVSKEFLLERNILFLQPQGYLSMLTLEKSASLVITDSGGVQKEAYFAKVPSLIMRNETEWQQLVNFGYARLTTPAKLTSDLPQMLTKNVKFQKYLYGRGNAVDLIIANLLG